MAKKRKQQPAPVAPRRRMYQGAQVSRLTADWVTSNTSADSEVYGSAQKLRDRARQLCRDNDYARQALRAIESNVIGQGIPFQAQVRMQRGGRLDAPINDAIEAAWRQWSQARYSSDWCGRASAAGQSRWHWRCWRLTCWTMA